MIHLKCQVLFFEKYQNQLFRMSSATHLLRALRVSITICEVNLCIFMVAVNMFSSQDTGQQIRGFISTKKFVFRFHSFLPSSYNNTNIIIR